MKSKRPAHPVAPSRSTLVDDPVVERVTETFKILADPTRFRIMVALSEKELCTLEIAQMLHTTESAVSHQLRLLKALRLVKFRKEGRMVRYSLDDGHIEELIRVALQHHHEGHA